jgi:hypothetical protein
VRRRPGLGKEGGGRPRGSPRAHFGGLEGVLEGPVGQLGGARRWPPRRRGNSGEVGRSRAMHSRGGFHGVPREV